MPGFDEGKSMSKNIDVSVRSIIKNYRDHQPRSPKGFVGASWNWKEREHLSVSYNKNDYVTLANFTYAYLGGAHGVFETTYYTFDVKNKTKVELNDIIAIDSTTLEHLIEAQFREDSGLAPEQSLEEAGLFKNEIKPNDNFYFSRQGLTFYYNIYSIGPFVMGPTPITIQWKKLAPYVKTDFARRMDFGVKVGDSAK